MHGTLVAAGVLFIAVIAVHIFFKALKFTLGLFFLGMALITVIYVFQHYLGIDLISAIFGSP